MSTFSSNKPYPEIRVEGENLYYASLLMDDYAGIISELSAITQYVYHSIFSEIIDKELSQLLIGIAKVEMRHLNILGKLIELLGGKATFCGGVSLNNKPWSGNVIYYGDDICSQLKIDLLSEQMIVAQYEKDIKLIDDKYVVENIQRIIQDEQVHLKLFEGAINKYCKC